MSSSTLKFAPLQSCVDVSFWSELTDLKLNALKLADHAVPVTGWFSPSRYAQLPGQLSLDAGSLHSAAVAVPASGATATTAAIAGAAPAATTATPAGHEGPVDPLTAAARACTDARLPSAAVAPADEVVTAKSSATAGAAPAAPTAAVAEQGALPVEGAGATRTGRLGEHAAPGSLRNFNTIDAFKAFSKQDLLQQAASQVWQDIQNGAAEQQPSRLCRFWLLAFADLKQFHFTYWFLFPALKPPAPFQLRSASTVLQALGDTVAQKVAAVCDAWRNLAHNDNAAPEPSSHSAPSISQPNDHLWLLASSKADHSDLAALPISQFAQAKAAHASVMLAMADTSNLEGHPGWPLRNALLLAVVRWRVTELQVVCVRDARGRTCVARSQLLHVVLPAPPTGWCNTSAPEAVGWEVGPEGRLAPRSINLSSQLSPHHLADQAVDLNLALMKWRAAPSLDTQRVARTKCLLLGAGTLGCAVARMLLGWGVRHITFVDSSHVSFSNPVRQSLFEFQDCLEGGKPKAQAAADALRRVFPSVTAQGLQLSIPMPGHPPATPAHEAAMQAAAQQLDSLVQGHDAVFLLTDTRESRWLPALLAAVHHRIAITAAVGFDSFLVMRHGGGPPPTPAAINQQDGTTPQQRRAAGQDPHGDPSHNLSNSPSHGPSHMPGQAGCPRLGCYFCNDVVAPVNSTRDRTLDQQCTVARPGLAPIAGALSVELLVSLLQHPLGVDAPTGSPAGAAGESGVLGPIPHMVRGQLFGFGQSCMEGHAFSQCTACSPAVVEEYKQRGWHFLLQALQEPHYLEDLTGLTALHQQTDDLLLASSDSEAGEEEGAQLPGGQGASNAATAASTGALAAASEGEAAAEVVADVADDDDTWTAL